jgi:hypothetical protein
MKRYVFLLVASAIIAFVTLVAIKHTFALRCNTGAKVCNFTISVGLVYNLTCLNGVQSTSIMPDAEVETKNYIETGATCGFIYRTIAGIPIYDTGTPCGTLASPLCE